MPILNQLVYNTLKVILNKKKGLRKKHIPNGLQPNVSGKLQYPETGLKTMLGGQCFLVGTPLIQS